MKVKDLDLSRFRPYEDKNRSISDEALKYYNADCGDYEDQLTRYIIECYKYKDCRECPIFNEVSPHCNVNKLLDNIRSREM
jgi:hypothetical protein